MCNYKKVNKTKKKAEREEIKNKTMRHMKQLIKCQE